MHSMHARSSDLSWGRGPQAPLPYGRVMISRKWPFGSSQLKPVRRWRFPQWCTEPIAKSKRSAGRTVRFRPFGGLGTCSELRDILCK
jgi:hypothetical protein